MQLRAGEAVEHGVEGGGAWEHDAFVFGVEFFGDQCVQCNGGRQVHVVAYGVADDIVGVRDCPLLAVFLAKLVQNVLLVVVEVGRPLAVSQPGIALQHRIFRSAQVHAILLSTCD